MERRVPSTVEPGSQPAGSKLMSQVQGAIRSCHYSYRMEQGYVHWIKRCIYSREIVRTGEREIGTASGRQIGKA